MGILPATLDDTYERTLQGISKEKWQYARQFFRCLFAAILPLRVEELAEMSAMEFNTGRRLIWWKTATRKPRIGTYRQCC
jgi:hypothetical protein